MSFAKRKSVEFVGCDQLGYRLFEPRRAAQLLDQVIQLQHVFRRLRWLDGAQIGVGIERGLKLLRIDLAILVENVRIDLCDHVDLGVSGVTLRRLEIAVIELELVGRAGMPEGMYIEKTAAGIVVLLTILISLNTVAIILRKKFEVKW